MESPLDRYLRKLHGALTFTDCAGIHAKVRHLHRNRVVEVEQFRHVVMEQWKRFGQQRKHKNEYLNMKKNLSGKLGDDVKQILNDASEIIEMDDERKEISVTRAIRDEILRHSADLESDLTPNINLMEEVFESMKNPNFEKRKGTQFGSWEPDSTFSTDVFCILGDPGYGKSVHLAQFAEQFVRTLRSNSNEHIVPVFAKAKDLIAIMKQISTDPDAWSFDDDIFERVVRDLTEPYGGFPFNYNNENEPLFHNFLLMLDAVDEVSELWLKPLRYLLAGLTVTDGATVLLSSRNSHVEFINDLSKVKIVKPISTPWLPREKPEIVVRGSPTIKCLHIDFTAHELRELMPTRLLTAWSMYDFYTNEVIKQRFHAYASTLTHPVFVGIFCRLLKQDDDFVDPMELDDGRVMQLSNDITSHHVRFLEKVIGVGIELAIRRFPNKSSDRFVQLFQGLAWAYSITEDDNLDSLAASLTLSGVFDEITNDELEVLKNGMGLLYSTDGDSVEWLHKTLYEVASAQFVYSHPNRIHIQQLSDAFLIEFMLKIADESDTLISTSLLFDVVKMIEGENAYLTSTILHYHPAWKKPLFNAVKEISSVDGTIIKFTPVDSLKKTQKDLVKYLQERSNEKKTVYSHAFQFLHCIHDLFQVAPRLELDWIQKEKMAFANHVKERAGADEFWYHQFVKEGELNLFFSDVRAIGHKTTTKILNKVDRWEVLDWFADRYVLYLRIWELENEDALDESHDSSGIKQIMSYLREAFSDVLTMMAQKIDDEYNLSMPDEPMHHLGWAPKTRLERFIFIRRGMNGKNNHYDYHGLPYPSLFYLLELVP